MHWVHRWSQIDMQGVHRWSQIGMHWVHRWSQIDMPIKGATLHQTILDTNPIGALFFHAILAHGGYGEKRSRLCIGSTSRTSEVVGVWDGSEVGPTKWLVISWDESSDVTRSRGRDLFDMRDMTRQ